MQCDPGRSDDGFATLEALVAFVILSVMLAAASQSIVLSVRTMAAAAQQREAMEAARALLLERSDRSKVTTAMGQREDLQSETIDLGDNELLAVWVRGGKRPILTFLPGNRR